LVCQDEIRGAFVSDEMASALDFQNLMNGATDGKAFVVISM
jgi:hypothetical protein